MHGSLAHQIRMQSLICGPNFLYKSSKNPRQSPISLNRSSLLWHSLRPCLHNFQFKTNTKRSSIVSASNRKRRSIGSSRSTKILLESAYLVASWLKILPEPLDLLIREFCGGDGGRGFFSRGRGGGDGSGGKRKWDWIVLGVLVVIGFAVLSLALWREVDLGIAVLGLILFFLSVSVWRRRVLDWVLGFCCCALGGFVFNEDLQRGFKFPETMKTGKRRKRR
ncbi:unnamed protein product [Cuscuta campestris]|uniref:Uncharacterized protein n=1 Tax=Cuscuta campestris TaxID=132261 RepID=A0A484MI89_9ASTE|nr:unnamed protein product [Cuscuta campestris]